MTDHLSPTELERDARAVLDSIGNRNLSVKERLAIPMQAMPVQDPS